mgnify:CR=1 FL=1
MKSTVTCISRSTSQNHKSSLPQGVAQGLGEGLHVPAVAYGQLAENTDVGTDTQISMIHVADDALQLSDLERRAAGGPAHCSCSPGSPRSGRCRSRPPGEESCDIT